MMNNKLKIGLSLLMISIVLVSGWFILESQKDTQNDEFCSGNLGDCDNQNITLEGELAKTTIHQHFFPPNILQEYENAIYLDTKEYRQIVLLSEDKINCENNIRIYGLLDMEVDEIYKRHKTYGKFGEHNITPYMRKAPENKVIMDHCSVIKYLYCLLINVTG